MSANAKSAAETAKKTAGDAVNNKKKKPEVKKMESTDLLDLDGDSGTSGPNANTNKGAEADDDILQLSASLAPDSGASLE